MTPKCPIIIGLGHTGLSFAHYLAKQSQSFIMSDSRENPPGLAEFQKDFPDVELHLGPFNRQLLESASDILLSPGIDPNDKVFKDLNILGDIELFAREAKAPIIAITGTNAKGTVTTLLGEMIRNAGYQVCVGGNIGTPVLELLNLPTPDFYVLEVSSFQLEITHKLEALASTILNMSPDHLDRHSTMENYHAAKQRIYRHTKTAVVNADDNYSKPIFPVDQQIYFGIENTAANFTVKQNQLMYKNQPLISTTDLVIQGKHNWANALAALALGTSIHLPMDAMLSTLKNFSGLEHRCEKFFTQNHVQWINDSKGTNVGATIAALEGIGQTIAGKIVLIAGGVGKNADFSLLNPAIKTYTREVILIGEDAKRINQAIHHHTKTQFAQSLTDAILMAKQIAQPEDVVLLSPACASFDMFRNFEDRGQQFKQLVKEHLS